MKTITQDDVVNHLGYLMGEREVPQGTIIDRQVFAQSGFEMAWADFDWDESLKETTITVTNGIGTMPSDYMSGGKVRAWLGRQEYTISTPEQLDFRSGEKHFRIKFDHDNTQHLFIASTDGTYDVIYKVDAPTLSATATPFCSALLAARAGLIQAKEAMSPGRANVQQEFDLYQDELKRQRAIYTRRTNSRRGKTLAEIKGHYTGKVG